MTIWKVLIAGIWTPASPALAAMFAGEPGALRLVEVGE